MIFMQSVLIVDQYKQKLNSPDSFSVDLN